MVGAGSENWQAGLAGPTRPAKSQAIRWPGARTFGANGALPSWSKATVCGEPGSGDLVQLPRLAVVDEATHIVLIGNEGACLDSGHRLSHVPLEIAEGRP